jgi:acetyl coenzyme A synthetase (ADP forming)-like protein
VAGTVRGRGMSNKDLKMFFEPESVAVVGASREPNKIGYTILKNFVDNFKGPVYPVNPNAAVILKKICYPDVADIPKPVDLAVIAVPAEKVLRVLEDCVKKKVKAAVVISAGFSEIGKRDLEEKMLKIAKKGKMRIIGPNCLGIYDTFSKVDTLFLPPLKLGRPKLGGISFVSQSGAVGSVVLDYLASEELGIAKFISYGNAIDVNEIDLLEYLDEDDSTKVICFYLEGTKDGRAMIEAAKKIVKKKPILVIKGGKTKAGTHAVSSHTGSLAGDDAIYEAAFKQAGMMRVDNIQDMFAFADALATQPLPKGKRVQIVTNGGGFGVLATDAVIGEGLEIAEMSEKTRKKIKDAVPRYAVVSNPLDLIGDADTKRYEAALEALESDNSVDAILCILLFQTVSLEPDVVRVIRGFSSKNSKPLVVCSGGGSYVQELMKELKEGKVPVFDSPDKAAKAIKCLVHYAEIKKKL